MMIFSPQGELVCYDETLAMYAHNWKEKSEACLHKIQQHMHHETQFNYEINEKCYDVHKYVNEYGRCYIVAKDKLIYRIWYYPSNPGGAVYKIIDCQFD